LSEKTTIDRKGILFVITAPSGSGKSTIADLLVASDSNLYFSISYTSRKPRIGEINGVHYHFVSSEEFRKLEQDGQFIEYAQYADNYYGTGKKDTEKWLAQGKDLLLDIEVNGAAQIKNKIGGEAVLIFILPPSKAELSHRLRKRGKNSEEDLKKRLSTAKHEIKHCLDFDYVVINDNLEKAVNEIRSIITAERHKTFRIDQDITKVLRSFR
jgi:guanylate kinase